MAEETGTRTLCIDIGGTGIKAMVLDEAGKPASERSRVATPRPATPKAVLAAIAKLAAAQPPYDRVSVGFPGVVRRGVTETAHNLHRLWLGYKLTAALAKTLGKPVRAANDADIQGWGAIAGRGVELVLTLGTGLGSALFVDGALVPNLEVAHHPFRKSKSYEMLLGEAARKQAGTKKWNRRLREALQALERLFNYDRVYIGGGNAERISGELPPKAKKVGNVAGLLGGQALWRG